MWTSVLIVVVITFANDFARSCFRVNFSHESLLVEGTTFFDQREVVDFEKVSTYEVSHRLKDNILVFGYFKSPCIEYT